MRAHAGTTAAFWSPAFALIDTMEAGHAVGEDKGATAFDTHRPMVFFGAARGLSEWLDAHPVQYSALRGLLGEALARVRQDFDRGMLCWSGKVWEAVGGRGQGVSSVGDRSLRCSVFRAMAVSTCCRGVFGCPR
ncbi:hypothetical protein [Streptomyces adustus]